MSYTLLSTGELATDLDVLEYINIAPKVRKEIEDELIMNVTYGGAQALIPFAPDYSMLDDAGLIWAQDEQLSDREAIVCSRTERITAVISSKAASVLDLQNASCGSEAKWIFRDEPYWKSYLADARRLGCTLCAVLYYNNKKKNRREMLLFTDQGVILKRGDHAGLTPYDQVRSGSIKGYTEIALGSHHFAHKAIHGYRLWKLIKTLAAL